MSKLTQVRKALQENPNITIVVVPEQNYLPNKLGNWSQIIDFFVAPKTGGVYTANELQALMMSLVPELEPTCKDNFHERPDKVIEFGKLYFDEDIGTEVVRRDITLIVIGEGIFWSKGFVNGKLVIEDIEKLRRRTLVRLFPNVQIATAALEGKNEYQISKKELAEYRKVAELADVFS